MSLKIGVVGTGAIGEDHINKISNILTGGEVVAVNDIDKERAQNIIEKEGLDADFFESGHDLIRSDKVDAVIVASWGPTHEEFVLTAIDEKKPVFCEKPLSDTAEGARNIVDAEIESEQKYVQVGFMRRFDQSYRDLKEFIDQGNIGESLLVHAAHRNPEVDSEIYYGDMPITDTLVHEIDIFRWLLEDEYYSVQVVNGKKTSSAGEKLKDPLIVLLETESGIRIDIEVFVNCKYGYDIQCQVVGEEGIAKLAEPLSVTYRKDGKFSRGILTDWKKRFVESYEVELQEWIDSTLQGEVNGPTAWDGFAASYISNKGVKALNSGEIIKIDMPERPELYK